MDTPGHVLKSERERQKKPLKEVARKLKINIKYLEAIEDDDYSVMPAEVFARSYIRLYADELELDSTKLLELFENIGKAPDPETPKPQEQETVPPPSAEKQKKSFRPFLIIVAAGLLILILVLVSQKKEREQEEAASLDDKAAVHVTKHADIEKERPTVKAVPAEKKDRDEVTNPDLKPETVPVKIEKERPTVKAAPAEKKDRDEVTKPVLKPETVPVKDEEKRVVKQTPAPLTEKPAAVPAPVPEEKKPVVKQIPELQKEKSAAEQATSKEQEKPVDKAAAPDTIYGKPAGEVTLKIVATELTWVSLSIDGGTPREWHLRSGQTITLKGKNGFRGTIGNAGGTKLYFNNKDIGDLGPPGKIIDIVLPR